MAYWVLKTEPSDYAFEDLVKEKKVVWTGVKNAAARLNLKAMKKGDVVLIYHTGDQKAVVGLGKVLKEAYVPAGETDAKAVVVEIAAGEALRRPVTLAEIKADRRLAGWGLVKMGRLSVVPTSAEIFDVIDALSRQTGR